MADAVRSASRARIGKRSFLTAALGWIARHKVLGVLALLYAADLGLVLVNAPHNPLPEIRSIFREQLAQHASVFAEPFVVTLHGELGVSAVVVDTIAGKQEPTNKTTCALFVHGFPDNAATFAPLLAALGAEAHQYATRFVVAVLPGYEPRSALFNQTFTVTSIATDMQFWLRELNCDRVHVVGHDWGAILASALSTPALSNTTSRRACCSVAGLASTSLLAVPPRMIPALFQEPKQILLSWYMLFFQLPLVPKLWLRGQGVRFLWRRWSPVSTASHLAVIDAVEAQFSSWSVLSAAVSYYRHNVGSILLCLFVLLISVKRIFPRGMNAIAFLLAITGLLMILPGMLESVPSVFSSPAVLAPFFSADAARNRLFFMDPLPHGAPVLVLAGAEDGCISADTIRAALPDWAASNLFPHGFELDVLPGCGHFMQLDDPARVAARLAAFWTKHP